MKAASRCSAAPSCTAPNGRTTRASPSGVGFSVRGTIVNQKPTFRVQHSDDLYGLDKIVTPAQTFSYGADGRVAVRDVELTLIPYYAWCHRGRGEMTVWLPQAMEAVTVSR